MNEDNFNSFLKQQVDGWEQSTVSSFDKESVWQRVGGRSKRKRRNYLLAAAISLPLLFLSPFLITKWMGHMPGQANVNKVVVNKVVPAKPVISKTAPAARPLKKGITSVQIRQQPLSVTQPEILPLPQNEPVELEQQAPAAIIALKVQPVEAAQKQPDPIAEDIKVIFKPGRLPVPEADRSVVTLRKGKAKSRTNNVIDTSNYVGSSIKLRFRSSEQ